MKGVCCNFKCCVQHGLEDQSTSSFKWNLWFSCSKCKLICAAVHCDLVHCCKKEVSTPAGWVSIELCYSGNYNQHVPYKSAKKDKCNCNPHLSNSHTLCAGYRLVSVTVNL